MTDVDVSSGRYAYRRRRKLKESADRWTSELALVRAGEKGGIVAPVDQRSESAIWPSMRRAVHRRERRHHAVDGLFPATATTRSFRRVSRGRTQPWAARLSGASACRTITITNGAGEAYDHAAVARSCRVFMGGTYAA